MSNEYAPNPMTIPELVRQAIDCLESPADVLRCACVNSMWNELALQRLYRGSLSDERFRTPPIGWLNSLFVASRKRFARNLEFVEHLCIAPETVVNHWGLEYGVERCLALRDRHSAEPLLRPKGRKGPISLAIPFQVANQNILPLHDLVFHPNLRFLTIDDKYCGSLHYALRCDHKRLEKLEGLSIHWSAKKLDIDNLRACLSYLDLKIFQVRAALTEDHVKQKRMKKLVRSLRQQMNIEVLVFRIYDPDSYADFSSTCALLEQESRTLSWQKLRALHVGQLNTLWFKKRPSIDTILVLDLSEFRNILEPDYLDELARAISLCKNLRTLRFEIDHPYSVSFLLTVARGCPLLQRLKVSSWCAPGPEMQEDEFSEFSKALPQLESLLLHIVGSKMTGAKLKEFTESCPKLKILALNGTKVCLSLESLKETSPLLSLRRLDLNQICFEDSNRNMSDSALRHIATEWRRIFPKLERRPYVHICEMPGTIYDDSDQDGDEEHVSDTNQNEDRSDAETHETMQDLGVVQESETSSDDSGTESTQDEDVSDPETEGDLQSSNAELQQENSDVDIGIIEDELNPSTSRNKMKSQTDRATLTWRLWRILEYDMIDEPESCYNLDYMWQNAFETEIFGWPVVSREAFEQRKLDVMDED